MAGFEEPHLLGIASGSSSYSEPLSHPESVSCDDSDCTFVDAGVTTYQSECELSLSYHKPDSCISRHRTRRPPFGSHHSLLHAEDSELGTSGTLDSCSFGDDWHTSLEASESGYFTNTERGSPRHTEETSLIHTPRQLTSQRDPSAVASRELVLYLRHSRAWEVDDLVAAWRCFVQSRRGKKWVTYGIVGIVVLLQATLVNFLASGL